MVLVTDANIWIDLHHAGLSRAALKISASWIIPDLVLHELKEPDGAALLEGELQERALSGDEIEQLVIWARRYPRPGRTDLAALLIAQLEGGILLTGDGALRDAAHAASVEVHGVLWVLDRWSHVGFLIQRQQRTD